MTISRLLLLFLCVLFSKHLLSQKITLIHNVNIVDGNAKPAYKAFVLIQDSKIIYIGSKKPNASIDLVIDGKGKILAPGFIDSHSHHFGDLNKNKAGLSTSSQGITTIVIGQDGNSYPMDSLTKWMQANPVVSNVASYTGQSSLREIAMGENDLYRNATAKEIDQMKSILASELEKGSLGLSTGLEYEASFYSSKQEVLDLAKVTAGFNKNLKNFFRAPSTFSFSSLLALISMYSGMPCSFEVPLGKLFDEESLEAEIPAIAAGVIIMAKAAKTRNAVLSAEASLAT